MIKARICQLCGKDFVKRKSGETIANFNLRIYCSRECYYGKNRLLTRDCAGCGAEIKIPDRLGPAHFLQMKYCSNECYNKNTSKVRNFVDRTGSEFNNLKFVKYLGECKWEMLCYCGESFEAFAQNVMKGHTTSCGCYQKKMASARAKARVGPKHHMWNPELSDEDRIQRRSRKEDVNWRRRILTKYKYKCFLCDSKKELCAHHLDAWASCPERRLDNTNGVCLCRKCHKAFHRMYGRSGTTSEEFLEFALITKPRLINNA